MVAEDLRTQISRVNRTSFEITKPPPIISEILARLIKINHPKLIKMILDDVMSETVVLLNHLESHNNKVGMEEEIKDCATDFLHEITAIDELQKQIQVPFHRLNHPLATRIDMINQKMDLDLGMHSKKAAEKYLPSYMKESKDLRSFNFMRPKIPIGVCLHVENSICQEIIVNSKLEASRMLEQPIFSPNYQKAVLIISEVILEDLEKEVYEEFFRVQEQFIQDAMLAEFINTKL